jgi:hypothetical protein
VGWERHPTGQRAWSWASLRTLHLQYSRHGSGKHQFRFSIEVPEHPNDVCISERSAKVLKGT